jgi:diguanylate cyclase (GGDEF)-like protein
MDPWQAFERRAKDLLRRKNDKMVFMFNRTSIKKLLFGTRIRRDLWWIAVASALVFFVADDLNLFERIHDFTRGHEDWNLDEFFTIAMFLPFASLFFIFRRNQELHHEVDRRRVAEEAIQRLAHFDVLTGLPNRNLLEDRLTQAIARAKRGRTRLAVFFIDLDGFKAINDTHGHAAGDELLRQVAERIQKQIRELDTAARLGGDEFLVLLDEAGTDDQIALTAERLVAEISPPCCVCGTELSVSASLGISVFSGLAPENDELLVRHADQAMYEAKSKGKNQCVFFTELPAEGREATG